MCIRDRRVNADEVACDLFCLSARRVVAEHAVGQRGAAQPVAVSYTHLRAHETVLDLVCRLLLEKKKKKH